MAWVDILPLVVDEIGGHDKGPASSASPSPHARRYAPFSSGFLAFYPEHLQDLDSHLAVMAFHENFSGLEWLPH